LDPKLEDSAALQKVLLPFAGEMEYFQVSSIVNAWKNDVEECIKPI
jgi:hypothetical protein